MEENTTNENEKKGIKAKGASLWGQIAAAVWIGVGSAAQFARDMFKDQHVSATDIVLSGLALAACFTPVYFNLIMDKIKEIKLGA